MNPTTTPFGNGTTELELDRVLTLVALEAKSSLGKQAVLDRRPATTLAACESAQADLGEMVRFYHREGLLPLAGLTDVAPLFSRETVLELDDSWQVVRASRATQAIRETFQRSEDYPRLKAISTGIPDLGDLLGKTGRYFTKEGKLREEASAELRSIRTRVQAKRSAIQRSLSDVMNRAADAIQEPLIVIRGERYCIPVRSDHRNAVPGILHERSGSGASFFIEPLGVVEANNDLADLLIQEQEEIARITRFIAQLLLDDAPRILEATGTAGQIDAIQACAVFHDIIDGSRPRFSTDRQMHILDGRHPLLDERLAQARAAAFGESESDRTVVPISVRLDRESPALAISGPNAGGKTVALKTAGLLCAMGLSGLPIPAAEGTVLPVVDAFHVLVGDDQSVLEHLSTFSGYLVRLKRVLERSTERSIALLDELGSGTDPEEGAAIAAAVIEHLLGVGTLLIVTTHLSALKTFAVDDGRIANASMEFDSATGKPTYRMINGIPGRSRAIEVATIIGLPSSVIVRARERLGDRFGETDRLLAEMQKRMSQLLAEQDELRGVRRSLETEQHALAERMAQLEKERSRLGTSYREELERLKDDVFRQLQAEIKHLRELDRSARVSVNPKDVIETLTKPIERAMEFAPVEVHVVRVGDRVEHRKFKVTGQVLSISGSKADLSVSGRKMSVDLRDLVPVAESPARSPDRSKGRRNAPCASASDIQPPVTAELNLIGQRVDEALDESDRFLDRALLEGRGAVRIIHGFGTGTLRKAVREYLRKHPAVKSWRPGDENEGGDGATIALLE
ncbi:MAG TPA: Smr/MutS family protein [Thermoanaerobaculia bacterium]|nr:Smr/MutS family protein [Thermoanaerobaculia bacterium]